MKITGAIIINILFLAGTSLAAKPNVIPDHVWEKKYPTWLTKERKLWEPEEKTYTRGLPSVEFGAPNTRSHLLVQTSWDQPSKIEIFNGSDRAQQYLLQDLTVVPEQRWLWATLDGGQSDLVDGNKILVLKKKIFGQH
jgi:hypothetical protein